MWQKDFFPVLFHVYNCPSLFMSFIQPLVEFANVGLAIVGPLAFGIRVLNVKTEPGVNVISPVGPFLQKWYPYRSPYLYQCEATQIAIPPEMVSAGNLLLRF